MQKCLKKAGSSLLKLIPTKILDRIKRIAGMEIWRRQGSILLRDELR